MLESWVCISLMLNIVNLLCICLTFRIFKEITNNHEELLYLLRDDINEMKE